MIIISVALVRGVARDFAPLFCYIQMTMLIIDFKSSARKALYQGFLKGLGAPVVLFGTFQAQPIDIPQIAIPRSSPADDWINVGNDLRFAMRAYGETANSK